MVIQRWQSVLLFFAGLAICLFAFLPVCDIIYPDNVSALTLKSVLPMFILDLLTGLLLFISIFLFTDLKLQKRVVLISSVLLIVLMLIIAIYCPRIDGALGIVWSWWALLPILTLALNVWAYRLIKKDENTLKSYDRIR